MEIERGIKLSNKKKILSFVNIGIAITASVYCINKLLFLKSTRNERLYSNNSSYYNWKFGKIHYTVHGTGTPILLVHDLSCESSDYEWKSIIDSLAKNHMVYTLDLIGCGRSDKPKITYTNYLYVQLISDFIKKVVKHKVGIVATGLSSSVALMTCHMEPKLFDSIILVNPTDIVNLTKYPKSKNKFCKWVIELPIFGTLFYNIYYSDAIIKKRLRKSYFFDSNNVTKRNIQTFSEAAHLSGSSSKYLMSSIFSNYMNINICHALREINNPIQIFVGEHLPQREKVSTLYQELNPSIEVEIIPDSKLLPQLENAEKFIEICDIYL